MSEQGKIEKEGIKQIQEVTRKWFIKAASGESLLNLTEDSHKFIIKAITVSTLLLITPLVELVEPEPVPRIPGFGIITAILSTWSSINTTQKEKTQID